MPVRFVLSLLALLLAPTPGAHASAPPAPGAAPRAALQLDPAVVLADLDGHFETLADSAGTLALADVLHGPAAGAFRPTPSVVTREDLLPRVVWARFRVRGPSDVPTAWRLETFLERVEVYVVDAAGRVERTVMGVDVPPEERTVDQGWPGAVDLVLPPGGERLVLARMVHDPDGSEMTSRTRPFHVRPASAAATIGRRHMVFQGLFLSLLLTLAVYNLSFFAALRDPSYLAYVGYAVGVAAFFALYYRFDYDVLGLGDVRWSPVVQLGAMALAGAAYPLFVRSFLRVSGTDQRLDRALVALAVALGLVLPLVGVLGWRAALAVHSAALTAAMVVSTWAVWRAWRSGFRPAGLLLLSTVALSVSAVGAVGPAIGLPHVWGAVLWLQVGIAVEAVILSVALADRVTHLRRTRDDAFVGRARAEEALDAVQRANDALQEADSLKTRLLGMAAHDLRNPLTGILGYSDLLYDEAGDDEAREYLGVIRKDARRMVRLVDDLLVTSALESGRLVLDRERVDAATVVEAAVASYRSRARDKRQRLVTQCGPGLHVEADADRLCDAVANLVSNAVKYTPPEGTIAVRAERVGGEVQISVADTGPGLTPEDQAHLFQPFRRLGPRPTGGETSTGLGLSIVAQIVELHGGRVGVRSVAGEGSTFWISLPALAEAASPLPAGSEAVGAA